MGGEFDASPSWDVATRSPGGTELAHALGGTLLTLDDAQRGQAAVRPVVLLLDPTDPAGGRTWAAAADIVVDALRLRARAEHPRVTIVLVGPSDCPAAPEVAEAAATWATQLPLDDDRLQPWHGDTLLGSVLAADPQRDHLRTAAAIVFALFPAAPVLRVDELLVPHAAGPWLSRARQHVAGRAVPASPSSTAITVGDLAVAIQRTPSVPDHTVAASADPEAAALAIAVRERQAMPSAADLSVPVVVPPRPDTPSLIAERQQRAVWEGTVKWGNTWTLELTRRLHEHLKLTDQQQVLTTTSGTAALRMAYEATVKAVSPGDVAVLPSFTFAASGESLLQLGYRLRLVDVDPVTWTMDPDRLREALADGRAKLIVVVDALGVPADHARVAAVAAEFGVPVVADSAPSLGALYGGVPLGTQQQAHAYSLSFAKTVTAGGAGGALVLPADARVDDGRNWWRSSSMVESHAITALEQLDRVESLVARRSEVADVYDEVIAGRNVARQQVRPGDRHAWVHYVLQLPTTAARDALALALAERQIQTKPYYAPVLHDLAWKDTFGATPQGVEHGDLPVTDLLAATTLALPMSSEYTRAQVAHVATVLDQALDRIS